MGALWKPLSLKVILQECRLKIELANETLQQKYPEYRKDGKFLILSFVRRAERRVVGKRGDVLNPAQLEQDMPDREYKWNW